MKKYSAFIYDPILKESYSIKNLSYNNKNEFIEDLRANGLRVDELKVKEASLFDYIVENPKGKKYDWKLKEIP